MNEFDNLLKQLRDEFVSEFPERCDTLEEAVLSFGDGKTDKFDEIYRFVHSLKGAGSQFGFSLVTSICHQFESFLSSGSFTTEQLSMSYALSYVDLLKKMSDCLVQDGISTHSLEHELDELRKSSMPGRATVLLIESSASRRKLCQGILASLGVRIVMQDRGMLALEQLLHQPFDLVIAARELPDLNTVAIVAALRESHCRNQHVPVILVSSNATPIPDYLTIIAVLARDEHFIPNLTKMASQALKGK